MCFTVSYSFDISNYIHIENYNIFPIGFTLFLVENKHLYIFLLYSLYFNYVHLSTYTMQINISIKYYANTNVFLSQKEKTDRANYTSRLLFFTQRSIFILFLLQFRRSKQALQNDEEG